MSSSPRRWRLASLTLAIGLVAGTAWPCGPFLPNQLLLKASEATTFLPAGSLEHLLAKWTLPPAQRLPVVKLDTHAAELADFQDLLPQGLRDQAAKLAGLLQDARQADDASRAAALRSVPAELRLYVQGAARYHAGNWTEARKAWQSLLDLPPDQRRLRSTWAAYMLGRTALHDDPTSAPQWFQQVRTLATAGFADRLGQAHASLGWEARAHLLARTPQERIRAMELYLEQARHGDPDAVASVRFACRHLASDAVTLAAAATHPKVRRVLTAWLLTQALPEPWEGDDTPRFQPELAWLQAVAQVAPAATEGIGHLAWLAYRHGKFDLAKRWVEVAMPGDAEAQWVRAKLAAKAGRTSEAVQALQVAERGLPGPGWPGYDMDEFSFSGWGSSTPPQARASADLALLSLAGQDYPAAFDRLARAGYWLDAAWVGERLLTIEQLKAWTDANARSPGEDKAVASTVSTDPARQRDVRELLGRRLVRVGRWREALPYLARFRDDLEKLSGHLEHGRDPARPAPERALALWRAAQITREKGMELQGTETEPDWAVMQGSYPFWEVLTERRKDRGIARPSQEEVARATATAPQPNHRFHYRHVAAGLAAEASALLPDQDPKAEAMLCWAAHWLHKKHDVTAYYRAFRKRFRGSQYLAAFPTVCPAQP